MSLLQDARRQINAQELDPGRLIGSPLACLEADGLLQSLDQSPICAADCLLKAQQSAQQYLLSDERDGLKSEPLLTRFLQEYSLSSSEGLALMSLAEALLRIPNSRTAGRLIRDKLMGMDWGAHRGGSESMRVNASTWGLLLTGKFLDVGSGAAFGGAAGNAAAQSLEKKMRQWGEPVIRAALSQALLLMGHKFVLAETIESALATAEANQLYSFDMLGEAAVSAADAKRYYLDYQHAIETLGQYKPSASLNRSAVIAESPHSYHSVSIKLSALHPRFEISQITRLLNDLLPRVKSLALLAKRHGVGLTLDAETCATTEITLAVLTHLARDKDLSEWQGLGICIQAYQTRSQALLTRCIALSKVSRCGLSVRLVKGAYWDSEIKWAQQQGLSNYPVFTHKTHTDCSYLLCADQLLQASLDTDGLIYPQFASHNALTLSTIMTRASDLNVDVTSFECQRLFGMGQSLHSWLLKKHKGMQSRIYAPVGAHKTLLAYLVRRMLENGANSSFVNQQYNPNIDAEQLLENPVNAVKNLSKKSINLPIDIYLPHRKNSSGENLWLYFERSQWQRQLHDQDLWLAGLENKADESSNTQPVINPAKTCGILMQMPLHRDADLTAFVDQLCSGIDVNRSSRVERIIMFAQLLEENKHTLARLCISECGKTLPDALDDIREAIDFCHYYSSQPLPNSEPLGFVVCISPWNFPVAIFVGQVVSSLVAGNTVLAKPARTSRLVACYLQSLLRTSGFGGDEFQLALCSADQMQAVLADDRVAAVLFTGSESSAESISSKLLNKKTLLPVFVAETGGQNAMIVDASALLEQVVGDILRSSFNSAGQRCSAQRILYVQNDIFDELIEKLIGAMTELCIGDPIELSTDIGPVIDADALASLHQHCQFLDKETVRAKLLYRCELNDDLPQGYYFAPCLYEIDAQSLLSEEVFGPVLHVIRYDEFELLDVIAAINNSGYGLTLGVHSRIESTHEFIVSRAKVGNIYINRNQVGAVVGAQPFGGMGRSGTGPKAGGPNYVPALCRHLDCAISSPSFSFDIVLQFNATERNLYQPESVAVRLQALDDFVLMLKDDIYTLARDNRAGAEFLRAVSDLQCQALDMLLEDTTLPALAGESNKLRYLPRGNLLLICRDSLLVAQWWLQVLSALVAGNRVELWVPSLSLAAVNSGLQRLEKAGFTPCSWQVSVFDDAASTIIISENHEAWSGIIDHPGSAQHVNLAQQVSHRCPAIPILAARFSAHYLSNFCIEQVISTDTSAFGGNIELLNR